MEIRACETGPPLTAVTSQVLIGRRDLCHLLAARTSLRRHPRLSPADPCYHLSETGSPLAIIFMRSICGMGVQSPRLRWGTPPNDTVSHHTLLKLGCEGARRAMRNPVVRAIFIAAGGLCSGVTVGEWLSASLIAARIGEAANYITTVRHGMSSKCQRTPLPLPSAPTDARASSSHTSKVTHVSLQTVSALTRRLPRVRRRTVQRLRDLTALLERPGCPGCPSRYGYGQPGTVDASVRPALRGAMCAGS
jgi:hypothetical protein